MEKRTLGKDLTVFAVGLGCMGFSHAYGVPTEEGEAVRLIQRAFDFGYTFFDTAAALQEVGKALAQEDIPSDFFWIGNQPLTGCIGCGYCAKTGKCRYNDRVNAFLETAKDYDGFVFGAPVHFASAEASMLGFMDRVFFTDQQAGLKRFAFKPAAAIVSARRAGTTAALDELNKYLLYAQMPIAASRYWNMVHGQTPEQEKRINTNFIR